MKCALAIMAFDVSSAEVEEIIRLKVELARVKFKAQEAEKAMQYSAELRHQLEGLSQKHAELESELHAHRSAFAEIAHFLEVSPACECAPGDAHDSLLCSILARVRSPSSKASVAAQTTHSLAPDTPSADYPQAQLHLQNQERITRVLEGLLAQAKVAEDDALALYLDEFESQVVETFIRKTRYDQLFPVG